MQNTIRHSLPRIPRAMRHIVFFAAANRAAIALKGIRGLSKTEVEIGNKIAAIRERRSSSIKDPNIGYAIELLIAKDPQARRYFETTHYASVAQALYRHPALGEKYLAEIKRWSEDACWNSNYDGFDDPAVLEEEFSPPSREHYRGLRSKRLIGLFPPNAQSALEAGSGTGVVLVNWAAERVGVTAVGVDSSPRAIDIAKQGPRIAERIRAERGCPFVPNIHERVSYVEGNILELTDPESDLPLREFDVVFNCGVIEHFPPILRQQIIREMVGATRPGGTVIIAVPNFFSPSEIARYFSYGISRSKVPQGALSLYAPFGYEVPHKLSELRDMMAQEGLADFEFSGWSPFKHFQKGFPIWDNTGLCNSTTWAGNRHFPRDSEALRILAKHIEKEGVSAWDERLSNPRYAKRLERLYRGSSRHWFSTLFGNTLVVKGVKP